MTPVNIPHSRDAALAYDASDPLSGLKDKFNLPKGVTYLVGHSLGPASFKALDCVRKTAEHEWSHDIVRAWNSADWINMTKTVGAKLAPLIGAKAHEVVMCDSVSVNLFKLAASALTIVEAKRIIIEDTEFPTDQYIAQGLSGVSGATFDCVGAGQGVAVLKGGGVLIKSAVCYRTAEVVDMSLWEQAARSAGAMIVWDFSHATGVVPIDVKESGARLGAGCTYKYLNGGPGAPSFIYVDEAVVDELVSPLPGWLGHKMPFNFDKTYVPADNAARFVAGTPSILSLSALSGAFDVLKDVNMDAMFMKVRVMTELALQRGQAMGLASPSPKDATKRGGHVSLLHNDGYPVVQALAAQNIMSDFRTPDTIRFGFSPLYLSMTEVWDVMDVLGDILKTQRWDNPEYRQRSVVT